MAGLSGLDFQSVLDFQEAMKSRFGTSFKVTSSSQDVDFFLVASFSGSALRLKK